MPKEILEFIEKIKNQMYEDSPLKEKECIDFYINVFKDMGDKALANVLYVDGKPAVAHLGFLAGDKTYYYLPSYDSEFSSYSVGLALLKDMIENSET